MVAVVPCDVASKATRFTFPALSGLVMAASAPGWFWMVMVNCLVLAMGIPPACMADYKAAISNWHLAIGKSKTFNAEETEEPEEIEWPRMERTASGNWQLAVGKSKTFNTEETEEAAEIQDIQEMVTSVHVLLNVHVLTKSILCQESPSNMALRKRDDLL